MWQCCSLSWRTSELRRRRRRRQKKKKRGPPTSPRPPWRKTQRGSMRTMRELDDVEALGVVAVGAEGAPEVAAVLGLKRWRRHSLNSCL